ncbi:MAG: phytanoyl-CoA dioxygenase family protein [Rubripirellula sp.]
MLSQEQVRDFRSKGHVTVDGVFDADEVRVLLRDLDSWSDEFLRSLSPADQDWYIEKAAAGSGARTALRKLDHPVFHRSVFKALAQHPVLVAKVQQLIGDSIDVFFSQVFMKPPEVGGPKPIHQDNFYFGPDDLDATLSVWIALDDSTVENGCLYYCDQHQQQVVAHEAPVDEPFNLQMPAAVASQIEMVPAPVSSGGISFHHGNTPHQSSPNRSQHSRRAVAIHYLRADAKLIHPALPYDHSFRLSITR